MEEILHEGRFAGLFLHPSSLPNVNGLAGDFGKSAYAFIDYLVAARLNYWQVLPLGPCKYDGEQPACPYLATSSFALNPLFVSVEALVTEGLVSEEEVKQLLEDIESEELNSKSEDGTGQKVLQDTEENRRSGNQCMSKVVGVGQDCSNATNTSIVNDSVSPGNPTEEGNDNTRQSESAEDKHTAQRAFVVTSSQLDKLSSHEHVEATVEALAAAASCEKRSDVCQANFTKTAKFKERLLTLCYGRFRKNDPPQEYTEFCRKNSFWLEGYACFEALQARFPASPTWLQWPDPYKNYRACCKNKEASLLTVLAAPLHEEVIARNTAGSVRDCKDDALPGGNRGGDNQEVKSDGSDARDEGGRKIIYQTTPEYHMFVQYKVFTHWRDLKSYANKHDVCIFGDVAFYVNLHSSDVWTSPEMFQMDSDTFEPHYVSGAPPDTFCEGGQLWGHPVYDWQAHEKTHFRWWTQRIKTIFEHVDALRLDHFRGFVAYWRVPYEHAVTHKDASKGEWVRGPGDKLFDALYKNMGWMLPKKTIPAAMQHQNHLLGAKKAQHASHPGFKNKLRQMACLGMRINNSSSPSAAYVSAAPATAADSAAARDGAAAAAARQKSPDINSDIVPYNEPRLTYRGTAPMIVAEDLGLITEDIVILRDKYNILSMRVLQFAWAEQEKGPNCEHLPYNITRNCCVYTGTHDNDTLIGWWSTASRAQKQHLLNFLGLTEEPSADEARLHLIRLALESVAHLVIIAAQDLIGLGSEGRFNTPGLDSSRNWSWQLESLQQLANPIVTGQLGKMLEASGRVKAINDAFPM